MPQKIPKSFVADSDNKAPKGFQSDKEEINERSLAGKVYDWATTPLTDAPSRFAKSIADYIDPRTGSEYTPIRSFLAGATQGLGDVASSFTSPAELAATATGMGFARTGIPALRTATRALSAPTAAHGAGQVYDAGLETTPEAWQQRTIGAAELAGGAAGMYFPDAAPGPVRAPTPQFSPLPIRQPQRLLPAGTRFINDTEGIIDTHSPQFEGNINIKRQPIPVRGEVPYRSENSFSTVDDTLRASDAKQRQKTTDALNHQNEFVPWKGAKNIANSMRTFKESLPNPFANLADETGEIPLVQRDYTPEDYAMDNAYTRARGNEVLPELEALAKPKSFEPDLPQAARTSEGKLAIGADVKSLGKVLGTSLYKGNIAPIATKELLQNSVDAIRHLGDSGEIKVLFNRGDEYIEVADNGKGLTREEIETVFTDLGSSGKRNEESAVGGFGLAKAAPLLGGKKVEVVSIARDINTGQMMETSFQGTPDELLSGVQLNRKIVPEETITGTKVRVFMSGNDDFYSAKRFVENMSEGSPNLPGNIKIAQIYGKGQKITSSDYYLATKGKGNLLATIENESSNVDLIIPDTATRSPRTALRLQLSNNGMYQGTKNMYFDGPIPNLPDKITVDIKSKVPEGHSDYPFTANREELRGSVEELVKNYIDENLVKPSVGKRLDELKRLYTGMQEIQLPSGKFPNVFGRKISIYDPKGLITSEEMSTIISNPAFIKIADNIAATIDDSMDIMNNPMWKERLEKVGIIFDDNLHGIHIPNPGSGKSAILINPFQSMTRMTPDEASANILHTILHEVAHVEPSSPGHNEAFTVRLGEIYAKYGARKSVSAQDEILKSIGDESGTGYNQQIQEVLQRYTESRGREATTEDLLSGTGIGSKVGKGREGNIPQNDKSSRTRTTRLAADKLLSSLQSSKGVRTKQENIYSTERAKRFAEYENVKATGEEGAKQRLSKLRGDYTKVNRRALQLEDSEVGTLFDGINNSRITTPEKARASIALFKIMNGGPVPQRNELALLNEVFGNGFGEQIVEMHGGLGGVGIKLGKTAATMKAMMSSVDFSGPLRQGIGLVHRKEWRDSFVEMFKYFGDKEYFDIAMEAIEARPLHITGRQSGLFIARPKDLLAGEEAFLNSYVHNIPIIRDVVGASERAYVGFLNKLRADTFDNLIAQARTAGHEPYTVVRGEDGGTSIKTSKMAHDIANYINVSTGRGKLGALEKIAPELNTVIWSPRLVSSRLTTLNPLYYKDLEPFVRKEAIKSLFSIAATGATLASLAAAAGGNVRFDPEKDILSSDFGKARFPNNRVVDPHAGFQQPIVAAARIIAGKTDKKPQDRFTTAGNFAINKLSPAASLIYDIARAKEFTGGGGYTDRFNKPKTIQGEVLNRFAPIFLQDFKELYDTDPSFAEMIGFGGAALFGVGVQDYPERSESQRLPGSFQPLE